MRTELLNYLKDQKFKNFNVSDELPFSSSNTAMYLKNPKRMYLDLEQVSTEPFINTFGAGVDAEVYSVRLFFTTDAKQLPSDYSTVVDTIRSGRNVPTDLQFFRRQVTNSTSFEGDLMITEFEFSFTKLT